MNYQNKNKWYTIPQYHRYEINQNGDIRNIKTQKLLKRVVAPDGYIKNLLIGDDNRPHQVAVHRLVADLFLPNPDNCTIVNHIDENRLNCNVNNLEWVTSKQNANFGNCKKNMSESRRTLVNEYSENGSYIRTWISVLAISNYYHVQTSAIQRALNNGSKSCGHFFRRWEGNTDSIDISNRKSREVKVDYESLGDIDPSNLFPANNLSLIIDDIREREKKDYISSSQARKDMFFLETYVTYLENALIKHK